MGYIGTKPSAVPLTSADITDGIITSAKIADGTIVNADINATSAITLNKLSGNPNFRNRIINGDMVIDQRNSGSAFTINSAAYTYTLDRWSGFGQATDGVFTVQRSTTAPAGFVNSLLATVTTADASIGASQYYFIAQKIEGFNVSDLGFGTANAKTVTLSFWVRSSLTGTFSGSLTNDAYNRGYPFTFTISNANTFEYKTITIAGDTSGTWLTSSSTGIALYIDLGSGSSNKGTAGAWAGSGFVGATGSVNLIGTNGATFYLTGVQLEAGTSATDFEFLPIDVDLGRCLRYFQTFRGENVYICQGGMQSTTTFVGTVNYLVTMRATPTFTASSGASYFRVFTTAGSSFSTVAVNDLYGTRSMAINATTGSLTAGQSGALRCLDASATVDFSAEL